MLLRALIPGGFMLGRDASNGSYGLVLCSEQGSEQSVFSSLKDKAAHAQGSASHCAFAFSAMASVPGAAQLPLLPDLRSETTRNAAGLSYPFAVSHLRPPPRAPPAFPHA